MSITFDSHGINDMTVAVCREMTSHSRRQTSDVDTVFLGGPPPSNADEVELAKFGRSKNYRMIFVSFDPSKPHNGPCGFHAVLTDGLTQALAIPEGRLWKRDSRSPAVLLFPALRAMLKLDSEGRLIFHDMAGDYSKSGFELARMAVLSRAARNPGKAPVVSQIGMLMAVLDVDTISAVFAQGE